MTRLLLLAALAVLCLVARRRHRTWDPETGVETTAWDPYLDTVRRGWRW